MLQSQLKGSNTTNLPPTPAPSMDAPPPPRQQQQQQQQHHQNEYTESRRDYNSSNEIRRGQRPPENDYHTSQQSYREARSGDRDRERDREREREREHRYGRV